LSQDRNNSEEKAITNIINICRKNGYAILGSKAVLWEINQTKNRKRRNQILNRYKQTVTEWASGDMDNAFANIKKLANNAGVRGIDKTHLAYAVTAEADYLLTTDDGFEANCAKIVLNLRVINPVKFPLWRYGTSMSTNILELREPGLAILNEYAGPKHDTMDPNELYVPGTKEFKNAQERMLAHIEDEVHRQEIRELWGDDYIGYGDFTKERHALVGHLTFEEIMGQIEEMDIEEAMKEW
jgi:predicted nucleic acid-binding protein